MSKRLPKATLATLGDIRRESATDTAPEIAATPEPVPDTPAEPLAAVKIIVEPTPEPVVEVVTEVVVTQTPEPSPEQDLAPAATLRQMRARLIVERYTTYSALGGCIPLNIFDTLSVSLVIYNMVSALADHYQVPFRQDQVKAVIAALLGGLISPSVGSLATQLVGRLIPGAWLVSTAASSATAAACTRYLGETFIDHFESGGTALDFDLAKLKGRLSLLGVR